MIPTGPIYITTPEYEDLARDWDDLLSGLPPIDGWRVTVGLPDPAAIGQAFVDFLHLPGPPISVQEEAAGRSERSPSTDTGSARHAGAQSAGASWSSPHRSTLACPSSWPASRATRPTS